MRDLVKRWIALGVRATRDETTAIPLIDDPLLRLPESDEILREIWDEGDDDLHACFVEEILKAPSNIGTRFAALNAYYLLMEYKRDLEASDFLGDFAKDREEFRKKLAVLVGFQPVETCTDLRSLRWEIVNACASREFDRAFRLCDSMEELLPKGKISFLRGRLRFLAAHLDIWDDPRTLSVWDSPIGPGTADPLRDLGSFWVVRQLLSREMPADISDQMRISLRMAISDLEIARDENRAVSIERELILARCYAAVGQYHEAARLFQLVLSNRDILRRHFDKRWFNDEIPLLEPDLFHCVVTAYQRAEELEPAITTAQNWINEFPGSRVAYSLMARLHTEKGDMKTAVEWYRRGEESFPELGNDWDKSFILQLAETSSPAEIERKIKAYETDQAKEIQLVRFALSQHWPAFNRMDEESKEKWCTGIVLLNAKFFGFAVHAFSGVLERAIRENVFIPFREEFRINPAVMGSSGLSALTTPDTKIFKDFLLGKTEPTFGEMLKVTMKSAKNVQGPFGPFAAWLNLQFPEYHKRIGNLEEYRMIDLRNREDHFKLKLVTEADAKKMLDSTKTMISFVMTA